jgi:hypothetical protein
MLEKIVILVGVLALFAGCLASIAAGGWHFEKMLRELRKPWTGAVLGPFAFVVPGLLTDAGKEHRTKFAIYLGLGLIFGAGLFFVKHNLGIG